MLPKRKRVQEMLMLMKKWMPHIWYIKKIIFSEPHTFRKNLKKYWKLVHNRCARCNLCNFYKTWFFYTTFVILLIILLQKICNTLTILDILNNISKYLIHSWHRWHCWLLKRSGTRLSSIKAISKTLPNAHLI